MPPNCSLGKDISRGAELLVDPERGDVRLVQVEHGGLFGVGAGSLYVSVDRAESAAAYGVGVECRRAQVAGIPYDAEPVDRDGAPVDLSEYYGIVPHGELDRLPWNA
jgi:hypothetical protein